MKQRPRIYYNESQKALMWDRWKQQTIAQLFDRNHSAVQRILAETGGVRPASRCRSLRALTLAEREEISRHVVGQSIRWIAAWLCRSLVTSPTASVSSSRVSRSKASTNKNVPGSTFPAAINLDEIARRLNERPRKTLLYETPSQRFESCVAMIS